MGIELIASQLDLFAARKPARKAATKRKKSATVPACFAVNKTLKKGYRYAKGGRVVKAKPKK